MNLFRFGLYILLLSLFLAPSQYGFSMKKLDSLRRIVSISNQAEAKYQAQRGIGDYFTQAAQYDSAAIEFQFALNYVPRNNDSLMVQALEETAKAYRRADQDYQAIPFYRAGTKVCKKMQDPAKEAFFTMKIGRLYYSNTAYDSAMYYYQIAQTIFEENQVFSEDYGRLFHYIGSVHKRQEDMQTACEYYQKEVDYGKKYGFRSVEADGLSLVASHCQETAEQSLALKFQVLDIYEEMGQEGSISTLHNNIAVEYTRLGKFDSAYYYSSLCLNYRRSVGDPSGTCSSLSYTGRILVKMGKYKEALVLLTEARDLGQQIGHKRQVRLTSVYQGLWEAYEGMGNYREAMNSQTLYYVYLDSTRNASHRDAIAEMAVEYQTEKKEKELLLLQRDHEITLKEKELSDERAEQEQHTGQIYLFGGAFFILLSIFGAFKFLQAKKQKKTIEVQKQRVEEQNQDILNSMKYASSIQHAIIPSQDQMDAMFRDHFVFYKPRDIVSGDFYWAFTTSDGKKIIAVGDCAGHGVPGAMMSMLGSSFLNEMVVEKGVHDPGKVLDGMREYVKKALNSDQNDGMDLALCVIENNELSFAGANLPVYLVRNGELHILTGDKMPIGQFGSVEIPFETKRHKLQDFDLIYLFSDGYEAQLEEKEQSSQVQGKKQPYISLDESIRAICTKNLSLQRNLLAEQFDVQKGDFEQLDDVCIVGLQV